MSISCRFDYLQGTFYFSELDFFSRLLDKLSGLLFPVVDQWFWLDHGMFSGEFFSRAFTSLSGFRGGIRWDRDQGKYRGILFISGQFLECLDASLQRRLVCALKRLQFRFTRVDVCLDDWNRRIQFEWVKKAGDKGLYRYFQHFDYRASCLSKTDQIVPTCVFGADLSDKKLRFYNAEAVHGFLADRWELQLRRDYAQKVIDDYLSLGASVLPAFVVGAIDFVEFKVKLTRDYCRVAWWQSLIDAVDFEPRRISVKPSVPNIDRVLVWLQKQVAPSLAVLHEGMESETFEAYVRFLVEDGICRFQDKHSALITRLQSVDDSDLLNEGES